MIDLHTHTTASDGTDSPEEVVRLAVRLGLEALAITDHDTLAGADEGAPVAAALRLRFVRGVEVSALGSVHILGYFFGEAGAGFRRWLDERLEGRRRRNGRMSEALRGLGFEVTVEEAEAHSRGITGRPHFARVMRDKGYVATFEEAYRKWLGEGRPAYVEREDPPPEEAVARIRAAGGAAVLAHPRRLSMEGSAGERSFIARLAEAGLAGIEVWHADHGEASRARYTQLAIEFGLVRAGGSDYHGANKPDVVLGRGRFNNKVPLSVLDELSGRAGH